MSWQDLSAHQLMLNYHSPGINMELNQLIPPVIAGNQTNATTIQATPENLLASQVLYGILLAAFLIVNFILWILTCIFRNRQPLKSRGIFHYIFLSLLLGFVLVPFLVAFLSVAISQASNAATKNLTNQGGVTTASTVSCLFSMFLLDPIIYGILILFIARTARYSFVLNINKLKEKIFKETKLQEVDKVLEKQKTLRMKKRATKRKSVAVVSPITATSTSNVFSQRSTSALRPSRPKSQRIDALASEIEMKSLKEQAADVDETTIADDTIRTNLDGTDRKIDDDYTDENLSDDSDFDAEEAYNPVGKPLKVALIRLKLLKILVSEWFLLVVVGLFVAVWEFIMLLTAIASLGSCRSDVPRYIGIVYLVAIIVAYIVLAIYDMSWSRKTICSKQKGKCLLYCTTKDTFQFRIEYAITVPMIIPFMVWMVLVDVIPQLQVGFTLYPWINVVIFMCFLHVLQFVFCGYIVMITVGWAIRDFIREKTGAVKRNAVRITKMQSLGTKEIVDFIMEDEKLRILFREQAKREWSLENYQIYIDIKEFQKIPSERKDLKLKQRKMCDRIYGTYITLNAPMEVNLSSGVRERCRNAVVTSYGKPIPPTIFDEVLDEAKVNLGDTVSRFFFTKEFVKYYEGQELREKMVDRIGE